MSQQSLAKKSLLHIVSTIADGKVRRRYDCRGASEARVIENAGASHLLPGLIGSNVYAWISRH